MLQYLGRQPIIEHESGIFAYELFYRDGKVGEGNGDSRQATAKVINSVLNQLGTKDLLGDHIAFIKLDYSFLMHDLIFSIPKEFFVLALLDDIIVDDRLIERLTALRSRGYRLALNDMALSPQMLKKFEPLMAYLAFCKIDIRRSDIEYLQEGVDHLRQYRLRIIATKVETRTESDYLREIGIDLFQGYYFAKPKVIENKHYDPNQLSVIHLCNMMMSDVDIDEITEAFERDHAITLQLLQFINSAAFHFRKEISSIHQILVLMGRMPLTQWLLMMIYSKSVSNDTNDTSPLLLMVKNRTELMTSILKLIKPDANNELVGEAYFVGVLSLMDALFSVDLETILNDLNISDDIKEPLLHGSGLLGDIYGVIAYIEHFDTDAIESFMREYDLDIESIEGLMIDAIENVNTFEASLKGV